MGEVGWVLVEGMKRWKYEQHYWGDKSTDGFEIYRFHGALEIGNAIPLTAKE